MRNLREDFVLDFSSHTFCNHGSYGSPPKPVLTKREHLLREGESNGEYWDRIEYLDWYIKSCNLTASFVGANSKDLVLIRNTTSGINSVVTSLGSKITHCLLTTHTYAAMKNTMDVHARNFGSKISFLDVNLPIESEASFLKTYVQKLEDLQNVDFVIIDHISSASALVFPIKKMIDECKNRGITVLIDGAHAPGQLNLNLNELGADFYVGNLHKWCYAVRGTALLWVSEKYHQLIEPLATSHNYQDSLQEKFFDQGTDEMTNYFVIEEALNYYKNIGGRLFLHEHADKLLEGLRRRLCKELGCSMYPVPSSMQAPYMKIVKLPEDVRYLKSWKGADQLWSDLNSKFHLSVYISYANGSLWLRISCNCYNNEEDMNAVFEKISQMIKGNYEIIYQRSANSTD